MLDFFKKIYSKKQSKIIFVDARFWHKGRTGIGRITEQFLNHQDPNIKLIALGSKEVKKKFNIQVIETKVEEIGIIFFLQNLLLNFFFLNSTCLIIFPHYFSTFYFRPKIVVSHDLMAITDYEYFFTKRKKIKKNILKNILKISYFNSIIICPSIYSKLMLKQVFKKESICIPNGTMLDCKNDRSVEIIRHRDDSKNIKIVGYVGNFRPHKNIQGIRKFCRNNGFELIFFSDFKKDLDRSDTLLVEFYEYCDAIIMLSFCEGFGIPLIEAALFGKYIFASKIPAFLELNSLGINYVDESTIVKNPIRADLNYARKSYRFSELKTFIQLLYNSNLKLSVFKTVPHFEVN